MTDNEMNDVIQAHCGKLLDCTKCVLEEDCGAICGDFLSHPKILKKSYNVITGKVELGLTQTDKSESHKNICNKLNELYIRKNHDYGDSFSKSYSEYGMTMACIRLEDKLNRLKSLTKSTSLVSDESIEDTLMDLANYSIMTIIERGVKSE